MKFNSLYKLFVMNNYDAFELYYNNRFSSCATIKFDIIINSYQSFFFYDAAVMKKCAQIRELDKIVNDLYFSLPDIAIEQYIRKSLIDEIEYTNQIEGVVSTRKDINDLINEIEKKNVRKNRFEGIVKKYLYLSKEEIKIKEPFDIRNLYDEMLSDEIASADINNLPDGKIFRKDIVHVYKSSENIVHNGVVPEEKVIDYISKSIDILNDEEIDVLIRVSIFHYLFAFIHPFYDGNGRINRFITSYVLNKYFNRITGFRLSMTIKENLTQYLDAFVHTNDVRNRGDITTFVYEFLDIIYKSYEKTILYLNEKKSEFGKYVDWLVNCKILSNREKELMNVLIQTSLFGDFGLTKTQMGEIIEAGATKLNEILSMLKRKNLLLEMRSGRHFYYKADLSKVL